MRFEGTVKIDAPRQHIWTAITDPTLLATITPGVLSAETIAPNAEFLLQTGFQVGTQTISNPISLRWVDIRPNESLSIVASIFFGSAAFEMVGEMGICEKGVVFSAEFPAIPRHIPRPLLHQVASQTIRTFFQNLKTELEHTKDKHFNPE